MDAYSSFASTTPGASRAARDQRRRQRKTAAAEEEEEEAVRASLVAKAAAMTKIAENMAAHNEAMLQGIRAQRPASPPPTRVDWLARNRANVSANRNPIGRRGQLALAKAQVMAAATAHIPETAASQRASARAAAKLERQTVAPEELNRESDELIRLALEEVGRGEQLTLIEGATRRPARAGRRSGRGARGARGRGRGGRGGRGRMDTSGGRGGHMLRSGNVLYSKGLSSSQSLRG
jgi:hypothetical protein